MTNQPAMQLPDSLWAATAQPAPETDLLSSDTVADVAIIGAGFTGLRAALVLAESGLRVVVLDAGDVGWGASGRNGGQVNPIGHESPEVIAQRWGTSYGNDLVSEYLNMTIRSADELFALVRKHDIQCDAEQNGWIRAVHGQAAMPAFEKLYDSWLEAGAELRRVDRQELQQLSGTDLYREAWVAARAGCVQPLSYARGLARAAQAAGASIYTHSRVLALEAQGSAWRLKTAQATVTADRVIVGTNGYSDQLIPGLKESIVPVVSIQAATGPLTEEQQAHILPQRHTMADTRRVIYYFRKTADQRLVFGSAGTHGETPGASDRQRILTGLKALYPQFPELSIDYIWGGHIAVTRDHLPHVHEPMPGVYAGLGCNGRGVALSTVMGRLLAEVVINNSRDSLPVPVTGIKAYPFHRFHRVGIKLAVAWQEYLDRRES